ncbi:MAG: hypothetical protein [Betabaculovirus sp.]|nr:MAG: hypothetical protein [Betabaculovirus sp.]
MEVSGGGSVDLTPILNAITHLNTAVTDIQNTLKALNQEVSTLQGDIETRFTQLESNVAALSTAIQTLQNDVSTIVASLPNIETALANIIETLNAFVSGALAQWGSDTWDLTTHPVPTITNPFPLVITPVPSSITKPTNNNLSQDVVSTLNNLQVEVKRLNDYTEDFEKLLKSVDVKVVNNTTNSK